MLYQSLLFKLHLGGRLLIPVLGRESSEAWKEYLYAFMLYKSSTFVWKPLQHHRGHQVTICRQLVPSGGSPRVPAGGVPLAMCQSYLSIFLRIKKQFRNRSTGKHAQTAIELRYIQRVIIKCSFHIRIFEYLIKRQPVTTILSLLLVMLYPMIRA